MKKENKNSYVKILVWMCVGGLIGGVIGFASFFLQGGIKAAADTILTGIGNNVVWILLCLTALAILLALFCYQKCTKLLTKTWDNEDDEMQDAIDNRYDFWMNIGMAGSNILLFLSLALAGSGSNLGNSVSAYESLISMGFLLVIAIVCCFYQVAAVKQIRKKDPMKQGDAADMNFAKEWLASCDEAERRIIYEASYKTFRIVQTMLLVGVIVAFVGETYFGNGLMAVVLLTTCNIVATVVYTYYSIKLGKSDLRA